MAIIMISASENSTQNIKVYHKEFGDTFRNIGTSSQACHNFVCSFTRFPVSSRRPFEILVLDRRGGVMRKED